MRNDMNLRPPFTPDEARMYGSKGGKASAEARRKKRDAREVAKMLLSMKPDLPPNTLETMKRMGLKLRKDEKPDLRTVSELAVMQRAIKGDYKALAFLLALAGETSDSEILEAKAIETRRRSLDYDSDEMSDETNIESVRRTMDGMTDEQLEQYENLCGMFTPEDRVEGSFEE